MNSRKDLAMPRTRLDSVEDFYDEEVAPNLLTTVPAISKVETTFPVRSLHPLALREGNSKRPVYQMHKWWARRLGSNFRLLLLASLTERRSSERDLWRRFYGGNRLNNVVVLDPFMGGGTSVVEAIKLGARVIGCDIDPVAWLVTKKEVDPCDKELLRAEYKEILAAVEKDLGHLYKTTDEHGHVCNVINFFWVDRPACPECNERVRGHPHYLLEEGHAPGKKTVFCRSCTAIHVLGQVATKLECKCGTTTVIAEGNIKLGVYTCSSGHKFTILDVKDQERPPRKELFSLEYNCTVCNERKYKTADAGDQRRYASAQRLLEDRKRNLQYPRNSIPTKERSDPRPVNYGYTHYYQCFNDRQLLGLATLFGKIKAVADRQVREYLFLAFSDSLASNNQFCFYAFGYQKLTPLFGLHAYVPVTRTVEGNLLATDLGRGSWPKCVEKVLRAKEFCQAPYEYLPRDSKRSQSKSRDLRPRKVWTGESVGVQTTKDYKEWAAERARCLLLNKSSEGFDELPDKSVDIILTDPPYYDNLPYSEYSDFFYAWLRLAEITQSEKPNTPYRETLFVNPKAADHDEQHLRFTKGISRVFAECYRVMKGSGIMVFTFHHNDPKAWLTLGEAIIRGRLKVTNVFPVRSEGKSGFHTYEGTIKWDAVLTLRKIKSRDTKLRHSRRPIDGRLAKGITRWAETRKTHWSTKLSDLNFGRADATSLSYALRIARLSQFNLRPERALEVLKQLLPRSEAQAEGAPDAGFSIEIQDQDES